MGLMDGVMGGLVSAGLTALISNVMEKHGGLQGIVNQFEQNGLGSVVQSWIGTGANQPIEPNQVQQALGNDTLEGIAAKAGVSVEEVKEQLAKLLPSAIDKMTPNGKVAEAA